MIGMILLNLVSGFLLLFVGYLACLFIQEYKETNRDLKHIVLTKDNYKNFLDNLKNRKHMIVWVYYSFSSREIKHPRSIDVSQTRYNDYEWSLNGRGVGYLSDFWEDFKPENWNFESLSKYVHSYIEMERVEDDTTETK